MRSEFYESSERIELTLHPPSTSRFHPSPVSGLLRVENDRFRCTSHWSEVQWISTQLDSAPTAIFDYGCLLVAFVAHTWLGINCGCFPSFLLSVTLQCSQCILAPMLAPHLGQRYSAFGAIRVPKLRVFKRSSTSQLL